jgi:hypothetical protein
MKNARNLRLAYFQATATAARHMFIADGGWLLGELSSSYFPLPARRMWRMVGATALSAMVGAETALPCSVAIFGVPARVGFLTLGEAGLIRRNLRLFRFFGSGTSLKSNLAFAG